MLPVRRITASPSWQLDAVPTDLSEAFVSRKNLAGLKALAGQFDQLMVSTSILEGDLATPDTTVDLSLAITAAQRGAFQQWLGATVLRSAPSSDSGWGGIARFVGAWNRPDSPLHDRIQEIWLEFDHSQVGARYPCPCLFVSFGRKAIGDLPPRNAQGMRDLISNDLIGVFHPEGVARSRTAALDRCVESLPTPTGLWHVGFMLSRPGRPMKVVMEMAWDRIPGVLEAIGSDSSLPGLDTLRAAVDSFFLSLELEATKPSKIGVECVIDHPYVNRDKVTRLVDVLAGLGLCTREKREAVRAWPGYAEVGDDVPSQYTVRGISHFKVVYEGGRATAAKAYLEVKSVQKVRGWLDILTSSSADSPT